MGNCHGELPWGQVPWPIAMGKLPWLPWGQVPWPDNCKNSRGQSEKPVPVPVSTACANSFLFTSSFSCCFQALYVSFSEEILGMNLL